jgi:hypothetical protein
MLFRWPPAGDFGDFGRDTCGGHVEGAVLIQQTVQEHDFPVLLAGTEPGAGPGALTLAERLVARGLQVITTWTREDLRSAIADHSGMGATRIGVALLSWDRLDAEGELPAVLDEIQLLSEPPPVVLLSEQPRERVVPPAVAGRTAGAFWLHADSPHFVADQVAWLVRTYALRSQVLGALAGDAGAAAGLGGTAEPGSP